MMLSIKCSAADGCHPTQLRTHILHINSSKTDAHLVGGNEQSERWKKCKCLVAMLDTFTVIQGRKSLSYVAFNQSQNFLAKRSLLLTLRMRLFAVQATSKFMSNSELWTLTT